MESVCVLYGVDIIGGGGGGGGALKYNARHCQSRGGL